MPDHEEAISQLAIYQSYAISQGEPAPLQEALLEIAVVRGIILPGQDIEPPTGLIARIVNSRASTSLAHTLKDIEQIKPPSYHMRGHWDPDRGLKPLDRKSAVRAVMHLIRDINKNRESIDEESAVETVIQRSIRKDLEFAIRGRERHEKASVEIPDSDFDPFKSFVRKHSVRREPFGLPIYNELFQKIGDYTEQHKDEGGGPSLIFDLHGDYYQQGQIADLRRRIDSLSLPTALKQLSVAWDKRHEGSGQTFFGATSNAATNSIL